MARSAVDLAPMDVPWVLATGEHLSGEEATRTDKVFAAGSVFLYAGRALGVLIRGARYLQFWKKGDDIVDAAKGIKSAESSF